MLKRTCRQKGSRRLHRNMQVYIPTLTFSVPWLNLHRGQGVKFAKVQFRTSGGNRNFVWVWTVGRSGEKETIKNDSSRKSRFEISRSSSRLCQTHVNKDLKQAICAICNFATGTMGGTLFTEPLYNKNTIASTDRRVGWSWLKKHNFWENVI